MRAAWLLACVVGYAPAAWSDPITFSEALARASADSPAVAARKAALASASLSVKPAGQLPDPQLALGIDNVPVTGAERFRFNRDEMTMLSVGIMQDMPSEASRQAKASRALADASVARAEVEVARLEARLGAAQAWIAAYYGAERVVRLERLAETSRKLEEAASQGFGAASGTADAALSARLETSRIADQLSEARAMVAMASAELERWIGPMAGQTPGPAAPDIVVDPSALRDHLKHHVALTGSSATVVRAEAEVDLARAAAQSDWSWSFMYQKRDDSFGDMVSLGLKFSLPLFQSDRQAPLIDARRADVKRAASERDALLRQHQAMLEANLAAYAAVRERAERARSVVLPASLKIEALAERAQANGTGSLTDLIRAQMETLRAEMDRLDLEQRLAGLGADLVLEYGELAP